MLVVLAVVEAVVAGVVVAVVVSAVTVRGVVVVCWRSSRW